jgi:hypothetical protein
MSDRRGNDLQKGYVPDRTDRGFVPRGPKPETSYTPTTGTAPSGPPPNVPSVVQPAKKEG